MDNTHEPAHIGSFEYVIHTPEFEENRYWNSVCFVGFWKEKYVHIFHQHCWKNVTLIKYRHLYSLTVRLWSPSVTQKQSQVSNGKLHSPRYWNAVKVKFRSQKHTNMLSNTEGFVHYEFAVPKQALFKFWIICGRKTKSLVIQMNLKSWRYFFGKWLWETFSGMVRCLNV
jgi:hypothetical protein